MIEGAKAGAKDRVSIPVQGEQKDRSETGETLRQTLGNRSGIYLMIYFLVCLFTMSQALF